MTSHRLKITGSNTRSVAVHKRSVEKNRRRKNADEIAIAAIAASGATASRGSKRIFDSKSIDIDPSSTNTTLLAIPRELIGTRDNDIVDALETIRWLQMRLFDPLPNPSKSLSRKKHAQIQALQETVPRIVLGHQIQAVFSHHHPDILKEVQRLKLSNRIKCFIIGRGRGVASTSGETGMLPTPDYLELVQSAWNSIVERQSVNDAGAAGGELAFTQATMPAAVANAEVNGLEMKAEVVISPSTTAKSNQGTGVPAQDIAIPEQFVRYLSKYQDVIVSTKQLHEMFPEDDGKSLQTSARMLVNIGALTICAPDMYMTSVPYMGIFTRILGNSRKNILRFLKNQNMHQALEKDLRERRQSSRELELFGIDYTLCDLIGSGRIEIFDTPVGRGVRATAKGLSYL